MPVESKIPVPGLISLIVLLAVVLLSGCTLTLEVPQQQATASEAPVALGQAIQFVGTEISADFPTDWTMNTCDGSYTVLGENPDDVDNACGAPQRPSAALFGFEHQDQSFMRSIGLPADPTFDDLLALNTDFFELDVLAQEETTFLDVPALRYRSNSPIGPSVQIAGFLDDEVFLISAEAPDDETLDAMIPVFDAILTTVRLTE